MNWDAVAAIAGLAGSIALVASLVFLAVQVRRGSRDSQLIVYFSLRSNVQRFRSMLADNPELARIYRVGLANVEQLSDDDRWRFGALMQYEYAFFEDYFHLGQEVPLFRRPSDDLRWFASRPGARDWWRKGRRLYHPDFQRYVDDAVASSAAQNSVSSSRPTAQQRAAADAESERDNLR